MVGDTAKDNQKTFVGTWRIQGLIYVVRGKQVI